MLFTFTTLCLKKKCKRQIKVTNILTAFFCLQETKCLHYLKLSILNIKFKQNIKPLFIFDLPGFSDSIPIKYKATQYIFCFGKKKTISSNTVEIFL